MRPATNRQKKVLRFFGVDFRSTISFGAAGWDVGLLLSSEELADQWGRYLYLTRDFGDETDELLPFELDALEALDLPEDWDWRAAVRERRREDREAAVSEFFDDHDGSPFDRPQPEITFEGKRFVFTGKFEHGTRRECQRAVVQRGGLTPKSMSSSIDYLIVGTQGSPTWVNKGKFGRKIEEAIYNRRIFDRPAIVSEDHWIEFL